MNFNLTTRHWIGVGDPVHPLSRVAHFSVTDGRFIYVFNGYTQHDKLVLFNQAGLLRYDTLSNMICFLPIHWDNRSLEATSFTQQSLTVSSGAATIVPGTKDHPTCIYSFGGYSLLINMHINALMRIKLMNKNNVCNDVSENSLTQLQPSCCEASVISGHGILGSLLTSRHDYNVLKGILYNCLKSLGRRVKKDISINFGLRPNMGKCLNNLIPSPRDKSSMNYWNNKLYIFGGYGPYFKPPDFWLPNIIQWPFLHDPDDSNQWIICDENGGWNNQLIAYDLISNSWSVIRQSDVKGKPPTPRAAHTSVMLPQRGWMIIFGGRGQHRSSANAHAMGRLNDMHYFNLRSLEWTRIRTPIDNPSINRVWPCGRSWMDMVVVHEPSFGMKRNPHVCLEDLEMFDNKQSLIQLFVLGGWSNAGQQMNDCYLIGINSCNRHDNLEAAVLAYGSKQNSSHQYFPSSSTLHPISVSKPRVFNGFKCLNKSLNNFSYIARLNQSVKECSFQETWSDVTDSCIVQDMIFNRSMYQKLTLSPNIDKSDQSELSSEQTFHYIAYAHTNLNNYILSNYCLIGDLDSLADRTGFDPDSECLMEDLSHFTANLLSSIDNPERVVFIFLRLFLTFLLPSQLFKMFLRETDAWISRTDQGQLIEKLAARWEREFIDFSDHSIIKPCLSLMEPGKLRLPLSLRNHSIESELNLTSYLICTLLFAFDYTELAPLQYKVNDFRKTFIPHFAPNCSERCNVECQPFPRYWHTVTYCLNQCAYAIGGNNYNVLEVPIECYPLTVPRKLSIQCTEKISRFILSTYFITFAQLDLSNNCFIDFQQNLSNFAQDGRSYSVLLNSELDQRLDKCMKLTLFKWIA